MYFVVNRMEKLRELHRKIPLSTAKRRTLFMLANVLLFVSYYLLVYIILSFLNGRSYERAVFILSAEF